MAVIPVESILTISHEELKDSPTEGYDSQGRFTAIRKLLVAWEDRLNFAEELAGGTVQAGDDVIYTRAHRYPHKETAMVDPTTIAIQPFAGTITSVDTSVAEYENAEITVTYIEKAIATGGEDGEELDDAALISETLSGAGEFLTIPSSKYSNAHKWFYDSAHKETVDPRPGIWVPMMDWSVTRHRMPEIPSDAFDYEGKVNSVAITSRRYRRTFEQGTLLFGAPTVNRDVSQRGVVTRKITYSVKYRSNEWHKFPRLDKTTGNVLWLPVYSSSGIQVSPYGGQVDFSHLLR